MTKEKKPRKNSNGNGHSKEADELLKLLKTGDQSYKKISAMLDISEDKVVDVAAVLSKTGYDVRTYNQNDENHLTLARTEETDIEAFPISLNHRNKMKVAIIAEPRMGTHQSQISLLHWLYQDVFDREGVDFKIVAGGLTIGQPTPTLMPDIFKGDAKKPKVLTDYVVKNFPRSKKSRTYIISNRRELASKTKDGVNLLNLIAAQRDDLAFVGDLKRTFNVRGVRIKVMSPWDDNSPKGVSYGLQKIVDNISDDEPPHIVVCGGTHTRCELADYGETGIYVFGVPSLHTQMRRQLNKGVKPHLGCLILELEFNNDGSFDINKGLKAHFINLDGYTRKNDCLADINDFSTKKLTRIEHQVLEWFVNEGVITEGEISRRLNKNEAHIRNIVAHIEKKIKIKIPLSAGAKRYEFPRIEKPVFKPLALRPEDLFRPLTKSGGMACTHFGSEHDLPDVVVSAYKDAAASGVRRIFHAGDVTEGPGASGYRGHQNDVKFADTDGLEDYTVSKWPRVMIKVDPKNPLTKTIMTLNDKGQPIYQEVPVKEGETILQTDIIDGNHDCWAKATIGHRPVRTLALRMPDLMRYLGPPDGKISMDGSIIYDGVYNRLTHGDGGLGYTISTKLQKHISSHRRRGASRGKPTVLWFGNWHTNFVLFEDELGILLASFKSEDEFHLRKDLVSWVGMNIVELFGDGQGRLTRVISEYRNYRHLGILNK